MPLRLRIASALMLSTLLPFQAVPAAEPSDPLDRYDVVWDSPSADSSGSMPLGNGDVAHNVWVDPSGDLRLLLAKADAVSELHRHIKLGALRLSLTPNPLSDGYSFQQALRLRDSVIELRFTRGEDLVALRVWVDANHPVTHFEIASTRPVGVAAALEIWREKPRALRDDEASSRLGVTRLPPESADIVLPPRDGALLWYHRNEHSWYPSNLDLQHLDGFTARRDPLLHRTFGGHLAGESFRPEGQRLLRAAPARRHHLRLTLHTAQTQTAEAWTEATVALGRAAAARDAAADWTAHRAWWSDFWQRSFLRARTPEANPYPPRPYEAHDGPLVLGSPSASGRYTSFSGAIAGLAVHEGILPDAELLRRASAGPEAPATAPGLVAAWRFSSAGAASHPPLPGGRAPAARLVGSARAEGPGLRLASDARLEIEHAPDIGLDRASTVELWVRVGAGEGGVLLDKTGRSDRERRLQLVLDPRSRELILQAPSALFHTNRPFPEDRWVHLALVYDPALPGHAVYIDGRPAAAGPTPYTPDRLAQQWHLQRYVIAAAGRGEFPIKFNGSLFTFETPRFDADFRRWGAAYWFQNTRLIYWPLLATGDREMFASFFRLFTDAIPLATYRTKHYYDIDDALYFPETFSLWGTYKDDDYGGPDRKPGDIRNRWIKYHHNSNLELVAMALDYWRHTGDDAFARATLVPLARGILNFYFGFYPRDADGRLLMKPGQALETWQDAKNPASELAGLIYLFAELETLPDSLVEPALRARWRELRALVPPLPAGTRAEWYSRHKYDDAPAVPANLSHPDRRLLYPAEEVYAKARNSENPELYSIFPFRLYGLGSSPADLELARATFAHRANTGAFSWQQNDIQAALLGLTGEAARLLMSRGRDQSYRFPGFWNRGNDWMPDQCSASNFLNTFSLMALQEVGEKIHVLPAWPADWDVHFRLHAARDTVVEARYVGGRLAEVKVTPESQRHRLVLPAK